MRPRSLPALTLPLIALLASLLSGCVTVTKPKGPPSTELSKMDRDTRLQIFLDEHDFGPGKIDGELGEFGRKAFDRYTTVHGLGKLDPAGDLDKVLDLRSVHPIYTTYTIRPEDLKWVGSIPASREEQGKKKLLPYRSFAELVAERYHTDEKFLRKLNPDTNLDTLRVGSTVRVPNVTPFVIDELPTQGHLLPPKPEFNQRVVEIDTHVRMLSVLDGNRLVAIFPITPGSSALPAPKGTWKIVNMASMPYFRHDEKMLNEGVRSEEFVMLPPGPNSPVGVAWMGLSKSGVGMHGTNHPETIGRAASHGCIRLANWDAVKLTKMVTQGMTVRID